MNAITTTATKQAFHFRGFPVASPSAKQTAEREANPSLFDLVDAQVGGKTVPSYKRKSVEVDIAQPTLTADTVLTAPELALVNELLQATVAEFVKTQYVDAYKPVGAHDLATIIAHRLEMASRKPSGASLNVPSPEALALGEKVLSDYLVLVAPKFAPRIAAAKLITSKATNIAIAKCLGDVTPLRHANLLTRVGEALAIVPDLEMKPEDAASAQAALTYLQARLTAFASDMFASVVDDNDM